jgi:hypothetical protein
MPTSTNRQPTRRSSLAPSRTSPTITNGCSCQSCLHTARLSLAKLRAHLGDNFPLVKIRHRLKCQMSRAARTQLLAWDRTKKAETCITYLKSLLSEWERYTPSGIRGAKAARCVAQFTSHRFALDRKECHDSYNLKLDQLKLCFQARFEIFRVVAAIIEYAKAIHQSHERLGQPVLIDILR